MLKRGEDQKKSMEERESGLGKEKESKFFLFFSFFSIIIKYVVMDFNYYRIYFINNSYLTCMEDIFFSYK